MKFLKPGIYLTVLLLSISLNAQTRSGGENEKLKSLKIGFITQKLDLTTKEAQGFWPIYNEHQEKINSYRKSLKETHRTIRLNGGFDKISSQEAEKLLNQFMELDTKIHNEEVSMYSELKSVLPSKKILILHRTENEFNRRILEQLKKRKELRQKRN